MKNHDPLPFLDGDMTGGRPYPTDVSISDRQHSSMVMYSNGALHLEVAKAFGVCVGTVRSDILKVFSAWHFRSMPEACLELMRQQVIPAPTGDIDATQLAQLMNGRRIEIINLMSRGLTVKEAGRVLGIKVSCVNGYYLQPLRDVAGARNTTHLFCLLEKAGLLSGEEEGH